MGCACFKAHEESWEDGWDFHDLLCDMTVLKGWFGEDEDTLRRNVLDGKFCKLCSGKWEERKGCLSAMAGTRQNGQ